MPFLSSVYPLCAIFAFAREAGLSEWEQGRESAGRAFEAIERERFLQAIFLLRFALFCGVFSLRTTFERMRWLSGNSFRFLSHFQSWKGLFAVRIFY